MAIKILRERAKCYKGMLNDIFFISHIIIPLSSNNAAHLGGRRIIKYQDIDEKTLKTCGDIETSASMEEWTS